MDSPSATNVRSMAEAREIHRGRRAAGAMTVIVSIGWIAFVFATLGSAEERYFRTCTGSCLAEMPDSYVVEHIALGVGFAAVPVALLAGIWWFVRWLSSGGAD